jgi:hypothetical protein|tara:strand:- start:573 stop:1112 length:540 start_codon:yes stop_codon:yes gene_type:complete
MKVTNIERTKWGSYEDRTNSYDDNTDIQIFCNMVKTNESLKNYLDSFLTETPDVLRPKPHGDYGVDLGIVHNDELVATIDLERWSAWNEEWPSYYRYIHFLARKEKFLNQHESPFFMAFLNFKRDKVLMISKDDIQKYPTKEKFFQVKNRTDMVRELPLSVGHVFGENITEKERSIFYK